ncbi:hybrid sensor histidine kinase/response regulator [Arenicella chitinivorans]|uniref:histidine kinase n=1 Tax=Arenicella chitinivorans TaxID=1329800 RepID=A0A918RI64_9GAMM|nr:hybrid sensor histidine kinase/response regulator [Arenicella chitinivorans]GGZ99858.1 hybrid sensor histidine kinase/response regulator [Arenicella chitinivorans]
MQLEEFQLFEQTKALYKQLPAVMVGTFGVYLLTMLSLWSSQDQALLLTWHAAALIVLTLRWRSVQRYFRTRPAPQTMKPWLDRVVFWAACTGCVWGVVPLLFVRQDDPITALVLAFVFPGYLAASASSLALSNRVFLAFSLPMSSMFLLACVLQGGTLLYLVGLMIFVFMCIMVMFARNTEALFRERAAFQYENQSLVQQLTKQKETAESAVRAKNQFLAAASHDLRQPLHASGMFIDALAHLQLGDEAQRILDKLSLSNGSLNRLLHALLDISRLDAKVVEFLPKSFDLSLFLRRIFNEYAEGHTHPKIELRLSIVPNLFTFSDPMLLERVVRNLVENALKFTQSGEVCIAAAAVDDHIVLSISDTGIGIPQSQHDHVFQEFTQLNKTARDRQRGLGLGLTIVRQLCQLMNIELALESVENQGTNVSLTLQQTAEVIGAEREESGTPMLEARVILVIDDEQEIRDGMVRMLTQSGARVVASDSVCLAIDELNRADCIPDCIVADYRLSEDRNGIQAIAQVRDEFNLAIPAILVTGDTSPESLLFAQAGGLAVHHKPVSPAELRMSIWRELNQLSADEV